MAVREDQEKRMQTNDPDVAMLQIAWEMTQESIRQGNYRDREDRAETIRKEFQANYQTVYQEYQRQRGEHTPSFPPG